MKATAVTIVEVGLRDGFQSVAPFIPTETKIALMRALHDAGVRRFEATSFVSFAAVPQLADAEAVLHAAQAIPDLDAQVLVPNGRHAARALAAGARHLAFVVSVSERHNQSNVRRSPQQSVAEFAEIVRLDPAVRWRLNLATAFDCPYGGRVEEASVLALLEALAESAPHAEIALCDTTGRAAPDHVASLFAKAHAHYPQIERWAFHGHDTYGLGAANVLAAWNAGVTIIDAAIAGLGGCPFAPGATGNVATEDVAWMFQSMGVETGLSLDKLVEVAAEITRLPGAQTGGRVRDALRARAECTAS